MKLSRLWVKHQEFNNLASLKESLGDGYLMSHNKIFRNIRHATLDKKFNFSLNPHPLYQALPLSQLEWILSEQTIPYIDNTRVLKQLNDKLPENIIWDDISDNLKGNHVFHESCHAVARSLINEFYKDPVLKTKFDFQKHTLIRLIEESFANTCELLAITDVNDPIHRIFFELNSYVIMYEDRINLKAAMAQMGEQIFMKFMFISYLQANFLKEPMTEKSFEQLLLLIQTNSTESFEFTATHKKTLRALSKIAFKLNLRFRMVTTSFYLRLNGITLPMKELIDFDFIQSIKESPDLLKAIHQLTIIALKK